MRWLNTDIKFVPHLAEMLQVAPTPNATSVAEFDDTTPIAAALFDGYNGKSIHAHIWVSADRRPSRMFWFAVYDYMFRQCGVQNVIGTVPSSNKAAQKLDEHLGFRLTATVPNYYPNGDDMLLYVCTAETSPDWRRLRPRHFRDLESSNGQQEQSAAAA